MSAVRSLGRGWAVEDAVGPFRRRVRSGIEKGGFYPGGGGATVGFDERGPCWAHGMAASRVGYLRPIAG